MVSFQAARRGDSVMPVAGGEAPRRANASDVAVASGGDGNYVIVEVAQQRYAFAIEQVREIVPRATITRLPQSPSALVGMLRLRGLLLPVIDLRVRLDLPATTPQISQRIVVTQVAQHLIGFLVDGVHGLEALEEQPGLAADHPGQLVGGVAETAGGVVTILCPEAALGAEEATFLSRLLPTRIHVVGAGGIDTQPEQHV